MLYSVWFNKLSRIIVDLLYRISTQYFNNLCYYISYKLYTI